MLAIVLLLGKTALLDVPTRLFLPLMILWYTLAIVYSLLLRWMPVAWWHGPVQMFFDLLMVTGLVYLTGTQDSYFVWLYPLGIIIAGIIFSRKSTFIVAGLNFTLLAGLSEMIYYNILPRMQAALPNGRANFKPGF